MNVPELPLKAERVIQDAMRESLAQGYWLQHIYMQECEAAVSETAFKGKVTLGDLDYITKENLASFKKAVSAYLKAIKSAKISKSQSSAPEKENISAGDPI